MDIRWEALFSLQGRIGRRTFWILISPFLLLIAIISWLMLREARETRNILEVWDTLFFAAFAFSLVVALFGVRRLHDRGISGAWMLLVVAPFILAYIPPLFPLLYMYPIFMVVMLVIAGFVPGEESGNEYGLPGSGSPFPDEVRRGIGKPR